MQLPGKVSPVRLQPFGTIADPPAGFEWRGSQELAARTPPGGLWIGAGKDRDYSDKFVWWVEGSQEYGPSRPRLHLVATRLDARAPVITTKQSTHSGEGMGKIIVGLWFSSEGCWAVTGSFNGQQLDFVFHVADKPKGYYQE
ncbi:MAG: hypothetical protein AAF431_11020 [Pseudomonadota bacterium]